MSSFSHQALLYGTDDDYVDGLVPFIEAGIAADEAVFVAVPGPRIDLLQGSLKGNAGKVQFADMVEMGRNPSRIIPRVREFTEAHPGRTIRYIGEPIWRGRSLPELREATRHEALINAAFADIFGTILCPYDVSRLDPTVISQATRTHPELIQGPARWRSPNYLDPLEFLERDDAPLSDPPPHAWVVPFEGPYDLATIRRAVRHHGHNEGLPIHRTEDLLLAVNEVATNTLLHTKRGGTVTIWSDGQDLICEVQDAGRIADPMVGRRAPLPDAAGGRGLWLVNQLCDLVELRVRPNGTRIRLRMSIQI
jgi:anti-sigma regulatory factor (Ser/Thr protein kinase)